MKTASDIFKVKSVPPGFSLKKTGTLLQSRNVKIDLPPFLVLFSVLKLTFKLLYELE